MTLTKRTVQPTAAHQELKRDLDAIMLKHKDMPPEELLAIASQIVGMLLAFQNQRTMSHERAMMTVKSNIELGNAFAIEQTLGNTKGAA